MSQELLSPGQALFPHCKWVPAPPVMCCEANPLSQLNNKNKTRTSRDVGSWYNSCETSCETCLSCVKGILHQKNYVLSRDVGSWYYSCETSCETCVSHVDLCEIGFCLSCLSYLSCVENEKVLTMLEFGLTAHQLYPSFRCWL